ncbi:phytanoyl-CoA dioxygenase family protein [Actinomadura fulvescens]|uniref:Phytanoyl-CoA dioxygenase n=1 Tax=Actinomadura fulvescens TaxID=46160 RepID=A0ABN3Q411_9ACTN
MAFVPASENKAMKLSAEDERLLPGERDVAFYREHGWYLSKRLLSDGEVDELAEAATAFWAGHRDRTLPRRPPNLTYWEPAHGDVFRNNDYICYESATIARILITPIIGAVAARLARTTQIRLLNSTLWYKPPLPEEPTGTVPWHLDKDYWQNHTSGELLTAFVPLHDCPEEMGTLTMVDGSHRWPYSPNDDGSRHFSERDHAALEQMLKDGARAGGAEVHKIPVHIPKGHMTFHHCRLYHGSGPNYSSRPRMSVGLHLQDRDNRWREHRLADGRSLTYNHDVLVRKTPEGHPDYADPEFCPVLWEGSLHAPPAT